MAHVLIVEDQPDIGYLVEITLYGHDCRHATDGKAALEELATGEMQLLVLDLMLPKVAGLDVLRRLRTDPRFDALPIVVVTARAGRDDEQRVVAAGADGYFSKPFLTDELRRQVEELLALDRDSLVSRRMLQAAFG